MNLLRSLLLVLTVLAWPQGPAHASVMDLHGRSAGDDLDELRAQVIELAALARAHIAESGLKQAIEDFRAAPWQREANGLHLWGSTVEGMQWFDVGHPDLIGLDVSSMTDIEGQPWQAMAVRSASGAGPAVFQILFPHPRTGRAAKSLHSCFMLEDGQRTLCAGAFVDAR